MTIPEFHLHLGSHSVFPTLVDKATTKLISECQANGVFHVPAKQMRSYLKSKNLAEKGLFNPTEFFSIFPDVGRVISSGHGLLCPEKKVFSSAGLYCDVDRTLSNIQQKFVGVPLTIFLVVRPQADYGLVRDQILSTQTRCSWIDLVSKIRISVPEAIVDVWPIEYANFDSIHFFSSFAGWELDDEQAYLVERIGRKERLALPISTPSRDSRELEDFLDRQFEADIAAIRKMDDVLLCGRPG